MSIKLNYQILQCLVDPDSNHSLEIVKVAVTRFGDDRSEIQLGQTVPFVANVRFVLTARAQAQIKVEYGGLVGIGDPLFSINNRAEVVTEIEGLEIDADSVGRWISDHYDFTFHIRGIDQSPFRPYHRDTVDVEQFETVEPWLQEINTIAVRGEVIDLDFDVKAKAPHPRRTGSKALLSKSAVVTFTEGELHLGLEIEGKYASVADLKNGRYWIALHSEDAPDLKLSVKVESVPVQPSPSPQTEPARKRNPTRITKNGEQ